MSSKFIEYVVAERPQLPNTLRIDSDGAAHAVLRFSGAVNTTGEIGEFESKLSPSDVSTLRRLTADEQFRRAADDSGKLLPGASHRIVRVQEDSASVEKVVQWENTPDPAIARVFAALERSLAQVKSGPQRVLRVQLSGLTVDAQGALTASLTLSNPGAQPVRMRSPQTMNASAGAGLEIEAWPDRAGVRAGDVVRAPVRRIEKQSQAADGIMDLPPGQSLVFRIQALLKWRSREPHQVRLRYNTPTTGLLEGEVSGEIYTPVIRYP